MRSWQDVTPHGMPELAYVGCVEISAHDADTVYVGATRYKLADYRPYLFRTRDGGRSWQSISGDLPDDEITRVIRADPVRPGLLFAGTETGIYFSIDDGLHWTRMQGGLPVVPVYDLKIAGSDLIAATHGRSFWILDDITPLREWPDDGAAVRLVTPRQTVRTRLTWSAGLSFARKGLSYGPAFGIGGGTEAFERADGSIGRRYLDVGENPPNGAIVYYWLPPGFDGAVRLSIVDAGGRTVQSFASDDPATPAARRPRTRSGLNRHVWDLKHRGPTRLDASLHARRNKPFADENDDVPGPLATPGPYRVVLEAGAVRAEAALTIVKDPRVRTSKRAFDQQFALLWALVGRLSMLNDAVNRLRLVKRQLDELGRRLASDATPLRESADALRRKLEAVECVLVDPARESPRDVLRHPAGLNDALSDLIAVVGIADAAPTTPSRQVSDELFAQIDDQLAHLDALFAADVPALNAELRAAGLALLGPPERPARRRRGVNGGAKARSPAAAPPSPARARSRARRRSARRARRCRPPLR